MKRVFVKDTTMIQLAQRQAKQQVKFGDVVESEFDLSKNGFVQQEFLKERTENKIKNEKVMIESTKQTLQNNIDKIRADAEGLIAQIEEKIQKISQSPEIQKLESLISTKKPKETEEQKEEIKQTEKKAK